MISTTLPRRNTLITLVLGLQLVILLLLLTATWNMDSVLALPLEDEHYFTKNPTAIITGLNEIPEFGESILSAKLSRYYPQNKKILEQQGVVFVEKYEWSCAPDCTNSILTPNAGTTTITVGFQGERIVTLNYTVSAVDFANIANVYETRSSSRTLTINVVSQTTPVITAMQAVTPNGTLTSIIPRNVPVISFVASFDPSLLLTNWLTYGFVFSLDSYWNPGSISITQTKHLTSATQSTITFSFDNVGIELDSGELYQVSVAIVDSSQNVISKGSIIMITSQAPISQGQIQIEPTSGQTLKTNFVFSAVDWIDEQVGALPLMYSFQYYDTRSKRFKFIQPFSSKTSSTSVLPPGEGEEEQVLIRLVVRNQFLESLYIESNVTVTGFSSTGDLMNLLDEQKAALYDPNLPSEEVIGGVGMLASCLAQDTSDSEANKKKSFVKEMFDLLQDKKDGLNSQDSVMNGVGAVESLMRNPNTVSTTSTKQAISLLDATLNMGASRSLKEDSPLLTLDTLTVATEAVSNVIEKSFSQTYDTQVWKDSVTLVDSLVVAGLQVQKSDVRYGTETVMSSKNLDVFVARAQTDELGSKNVSLGNDTVSIPVIPDLATNEVGVQFVKFNGKNPYRYQSSLNPSSSVVTFKLLNGNEQIPLKDLEEPLVFSFKRPADNRTDYQCCYWQEGKSTRWGTDGCSLYAVTEEEIICHCNHTTSFAAFIQYDDTILNSVALNIVSIVFGGIMLFTCICLLIVVSVFHEKQPFRSRSFTQFFGLTALIIELTLQWIIRNSLLLRYGGTHEYRAINIFGYIVVAIVNSFSVSALLIFLWQQFRYIIFRNMYQFFEKHSQSRLRLFRIINTRWIFLIVIAVVFILVTAVDIMFVLLADDNRMTIRQFSTSTSSSFFAVTLAITIAILVGFLFDLSISVKGSIDSKKDIQAVAQSSSYHQVEKFKVEVKTIVPTTFQFLLHNDPFAFRIEALAMVAALIFLGISNIVGHTFLYYDSKNIHLQVGIFIADVGYTILRIAVFGGITTACFIYHIVRGKSKAAFSGIVQDSELAKDQPDTNELMITSMLTDPFGLQIVKNYAKQEMSLENVLIWKDIQEWNVTYPTLSWPEKQKILQTLHDTYISNNSPSQVNIPGHVRKMCMQLVKDVTQIGNEPPTDEKTITQLATQFDFTMAKLLNIVNMNLNDTFSRLIVTMEYEAYLRTKTMKMKLQSAANFD